MLRQVSSSTMFSRNEHRSLFDAQDGPTYVMKLIRQRVYWKKSSYENARTFHEHGLIFPRENHKEGAPT